MSEGVRVDANEEVKLLRKCKQMGGVGSGGGLGGQGGYEQRSEAFVKIQKKNVFFFCFFFFFFGGVGSGGRRGEGQGGCDGRSEVFVKIKKKKICWGGSGGGSDQGVGWGRGMARFGVGG